MKITYKSDISDETSSTLAEFAFGRSSNRIGKAKTEERFQNNSYNPILCGEIEFWGHVPQPLSQSLSV